MLNSYDTITYGYDTAKGRRCTATGRRPTPFYSVFIISYMLFCYIMATAAGSAGDGRRLYDDDI